MTDVAADPGEPMNEAERARRFRLVFAALMMSAFLAALDQTIVATALPTIAAEFGRVEDLPWIVTSYLLASTIVMPLTGKLGDLIGRKSVLQGTIVLFLIGSALCGLAQNLTELIAFRAVQGLGGGGLMVTVMAAIGDIVTPRQRAKYQSYFGGTFAVATVIGPLLGGFFVAELSWHWIFFINVPLGLMAVAAIAYAFTVPTPRRGSRIDYAGSTLLAILLTAAVLGANFGASALANMSAAAWVFAGAVFVGLCVAFYVVEMRAEEAIVPFTLFRDREFSAALAVSACVGVTLFSAMTLFPVYLQVVKGFDPTAAGLLMMPLVGGIIGAMIAVGHLISRTGRYRLFPILSGAITSVALVLVSGIDGATPLWIVVGCMLLLGAGLGQAMQVVVLVAQTAVDRKHLGVATSMASLSRLIGATVGLALLGSIFAASLTAQLARLPQEAALDTSATPQAIAVLPEEVRQIYVDAFAQALHPVFLGTAAVAAAGFVFALMLRDGRLHN